MLKFAVERRFKFSGFPAGERPTCHAVEPTRTAGPTRGTDRGRADPVSVEGEGEADPPAGTEYLPDDHAVWYVAYLRPDDEDPPERESEGQLL